MPNSRLDTRLSTPFCTWKGELPCVMCETRCPWHEMPYKEDPEGYYAEDYGASIDLGEAPPPPDEHWTPEYGDEPFPLGEEEEAAAAAAATVTSGLSPDQQAVVDHLDGPAVVIAGAGSGKTRSVVARVVQMVGKSKIEPSTVVFVTFTRKATAEIRERLVKALGARVARQIVVSTFHSLALSVLRENPGCIGRKQNFTVFDDTMMMSEMRRILKELWGRPGGEEEEGLAATPLFGAPRAEIVPAQPDTSGPPPAASALLSALSDRKEAGEELDDVFYGKLSDTWGPDAARVVQEYEALKVAANAVDFDDLIWMVYRTLRSDVELAERLRNRWRYYIVDEYQDTNDLNEKMLALLVGERGNVLSVGDEDQAIYGFRGANVQHILTFQERWPGAKVYMLGCNYRSSNHVVSAAARLIGYNKQRYNKRIWTQNPDGWPLQVVQHRDAKEEADYIARAVKGSIAAGYPAKEHAVLVRVRRQFTHLQAAFARHEIPFNTVGYLNYWERADVKLVLSWLRGMENPRDFVSGAYAFGHWPQIGATTVRAWSKSAEIGERGMWEYLPMLYGQRGCGPSTKKGKAIAAFSAANSELYQRVLRGDPIQDIVRWLYEVTGIDVELAEAIEGSGKVAEEARERMQLKEDFIGVCSTDGGFVALRNFLDAVIQVANKRDDTEAVTLITIHSAKGLEWDHLWAAGVTDGVLPCLPFANGQFSEPDQDAIEEERRLAYVLVTRARKRLDLCFYERVNVHGQDVFARRSRFLDEILDEVPMRKPLAVPPRDAGIPGVSGDGPPVRRFQVSLVSEA